MPQKQHSLLRGSHEDIPEEADDPDLGFNTSCGESNGETSRLERNVERGLNKEKKVMNPC